MPTVDPISILMKHRKSDTGSRPTVAKWPRKVVLVLWALAFVVGGGVLSARWDTLMARLARPPIGDGAAGALR
jgi:hypothetical protein